MSERENLEARRDEILAALDEPSRLKRELGQIDKRLEDLDDQEGRTTVYTFRGIARQEGGRMVGKTIVEVTEGTFVEMPHMMFEEGLGLATSPLTREQFKSALRIYDGGHIHEVTKEEAERLRAAGFKVAEIKRPVPRKQRQMRSARI